MQETPCKGHIVPALDLLPLLPENVREEFEQLVCDLDYEDAQNLLLNNWPEDFPPVNELFLLGDEDTPDDEMERGTCYVYFDEEDLYVKSPSFSLIKLKEAGGKEPTLHSWTKFG